MSRTVGMVSVGGRPRKANGAPMNSCTACGAGMVDVVAVIGRKVRRDALACIPCGRLGVECTCVPTVILR
jgi:hypothetical protein